MCYECISNVIIIWCISIWLYLWLFNYIVCALVSVVCSSKLWTVTPKVVAMFCYSFHDFIKRLTKSVSYWKLFLSSLSYWIMELTWEFFDCWLCGIVISKLVFDKTIGYRHPLLYVMVHGKEGCCHRGFLHAMWGSCWRVWLALGLIVTLVKCFINILA